MRILITGSPGTGKTTISIYFSLKYGFSYLNINNVAHSRRLYLGYNEHRNSMIIDIKKLRRVIKGLCQRLNNVVLEGHLIEAVPPELIDYVIVLRVNPLLLFERLRERGYTIEKISENVEAELVDVCANEASVRFQKIFELNVTNLDFKQAADMIYRIITGECRGERISWLERLSKTEVTKLFSMLKL